MVLPAHQKGGRSADAQPQNDEAGNDPLIQNVAGGARPADFALTGPRRIAHTVPATDVGDTGAAGAHFGAVIQPKGALTQARAVACAKPVAAAGRGVAARALALAGAQPPACLARAGPVILAPPVAVTDVVSAAIALDVARDAAPAGIDARRRPSLAVARSVRQAGAMTVARRGVVRGHVARASEVRQ